MAAKEVMNSHQTDTESVVNRWLVDYYLFLALEFFQKGRYADFCGVRDVLECVLARPYEATDVMPTKIRLLQFLTRINEGESLDISFETDLSITPLESALILLENINQRCSVPQQDYENVCASLKEMMVVIFIKNNKFDKAKEVLNRHFPKPVVGKKAMFMRLISQNTKTHEVIEQSDFQKFKEEMLAFCQRLCPFSIPFLHKAAQQLIDKRLTEQGDKAAGTDKQHEPGPSSVSQINTVPFVPCKQTIIQRTRLEAAYKALAVAYQALAVGSPVITFAQLDEEVEREQQENPDLSLRLSPSPIEGTNQDSEQDGLFQKDSGSPMEASPADQSRQTDAGPQTRAGSRSKTPSVPKKRRLYTVARLVVEPDSQGSSQCTIASQELETADKTEEPAQSPAISNNTELQNPVTDIEVTAPTRKRPRRNNTVYGSASTSLAEVSVGSEQDLFGSVANEETHVGKLHNQSNNSLSRNSTKSNQSSSDSEERPHESPTSCKTPAQKPLEQLASNPLDKDPGSTGDVCVVDCSLDSSPNVSPHHPIPQTSSTPHKDSAHDKGPSLSKWKQLYNNAKESKDTWSDEESYFTSRKSSGSHNESTISNSVHRKNRWTESETQKLRDGVKKFGEGNWSKIKAYYSFKDRTNVNLKDRWRTMKKLNMV